MCANMYSVAWDVLVICTNHYLTEAGWELCIEGAGGKEGGAVWEVEGGESGRSCVEGSWGEGGRGCVGELYRGSCVLCDQEHTFHP